MTSRIIAIATLGAACVVAAGGGAYLAVRQNDNANQVAQVAAQAQTPEPARATPAGIVTTPPSATEAAPPAVSPAPFTAATNEAQPAPRQKTENKRRQREDIAPAPRAPRYAPRDTAAFGEQNTNAADSNPTNAPKPTNVADQNANAAPPQPLNQVAPEPQHEYVDLTVPSESVLGLQVQTAISSETARVEDKVEARVTRDVRVGDRVAIPAGAHVIGSVIQVDRGGKIRERAQFVVRFHTLVLADGTRTSITTEALHREGPPVANKSAAKIGGATVGGAILGAILGGGKGAAIGGGIGAAGGTAAAMAGDREPATLPAGSLVNIRLMAPVTVTLER